jgi:hypothetical protein
MDRVLIEVDIPALEEVMDEFCASGDSSHIHAVVGVLYWLEATRTKNERLLPEVIIGNNLAILQIQGFLRKVGYSPDM